MGGRWQQASADASESGPAPPKETPKGGTAMADGTQDASGIEARVRSLAAPLLAPLGVELEDVQWGGGRLRLVVDTADGVDSGTLVLVTRTISAELDVADPIPRRYTLEVTSPGVERPLRRPEQYRKAVGCEVSVKLRAGDDGERRTAGRLVAADDERITLETAAGERREIRLEAVERARTVFDWGQGDGRGNGAGAAATATRKGVPVS
ncbi:MAG: ribosome maturation factor RimP [Acidimicrobiia bacterium]|nr:ribosome maturation factor RimP [Acidimicrobiia bacterium]